MATERLYYDDSYLTTFEATVVAARELGGRPAVALDRSAFYPEGGGQPADRGSIGAASVLDVQADDDGVVWHHLAPGPDADALAPGQGVACAISWPRRLDHMQQHCGQHILTAAFIAACGLPTVSFHLSEASVTIDLDGPALSDGQVAAAEDLANGVVWEGRPVTARFVAPDELARLPLRKPPSVRENIRVVTVEGFDYSACGGTHPRSTGGVGLIRVLGWRRQKGLARVEFACGGRALAALRRLGSAAGAAAGALSVGLDELPAAVERTLAAQRAQARELELARAALLEHEARRRHAEAPAAGAARVVVAEGAAESPEGLRALAQAIAALPGGVAVLGLAAAGRAHLVVACADDSGRDARPILQAGLGAVAGRGGGSQRLAQGGGPEAGGLAAALAAMGRAATL